eukprot:jgi/Chrzof1/3834/Cz13g10150.t1
MAFTASFAAVLLVVVACTVACSANSVGFEGVNLGPRRSLLQPRGEDNGDAGIRNQLSIDQASAAVQAAAVANTPGTTQLAAGFASNSAQNAAFLSQSQFINSIGRPFGRKLLVNNATTITAELRKHNAAMFETLLRAAGLASPVNNPNLVATFFTPSDAAIKAYAAKLGLTVAQLAGYPALLKAIARYHIILGAKLSSAKQLKVGRTNGITADPIWNLTLIKAPNGNVSIRDTQGNIAKVTKVDIDAGKSVIHNVDAVLLSGDVFINAHEVLKFFPVLSTVKDLIGKAGLRQMTMKPQMNYTMFAPINSAFKGAPTLDNATLANVLKYHTVPGIRTIPLDWVSGKSVETMYKGHTLSVKFEM